MVHLDSLHVQNYRTLEDLELPKLGRINLITGKNNVGKTSLLEAVRLWAGKADFRHLLQILEARDESLLPDIEGDLEDNEGPRLLSSVLCVFSGYPGPRDQVKPVIIKDRAISLTMDLLDDALDNYDSVPGTGGFFPEHIQIRCPESDESSMIEVSKPIRLAMRQYTPPRSRDLESIRCLSLSSAAINSIDQYPVSKLWSNIALGAKEKTVIEGIQIIEPSIERIIFTPSDYRSKMPDLTPVVALSSYSRPVPLHGLGDGVTRLFEIMLALVNAENGIFLIDEFENSLHYSIQEKAWEVINHIAKELNIQVFATTHSSDCITAFQEVAVKHCDEGDAVLVRLFRRKDGPVEGKCVYGELLADALEFDLEVR